MGDIRSKLWKQLKMDTPIVVNNRDINGNYIRTNLNTGQTVSRRAPVQGTIHTNTVRNVGGDKTTKRGRYKIANNQVQKYNREVPQIHNHADQTIRNEQLHQSVLLDKDKEPVIVQDNYTPILEGGLSGYDPLLGFAAEMYTGGKGVSTLGKTLLWNTSKYLPKTQVGNWGRAYFVNQEMKNLVSPVLNDGIKYDLTKHLYTKGNIPKDVSGSLRFFERTPSKISEAERLGFGRGFNLSSGRNAHEYYNLADRLQARRDALRKLRTMNDTNVGETIAKNSGATLEDGEYLVSKGYTGATASDRAFYSGFPSISFGKNSLHPQSHSYGLNLAGSATDGRYLDVGENVIYSNPATNVVITASNAAANKKGARMMVKAMGDMESGAEFSGDAATSTAAENLYAWLRLAKTKPQLRKMALENAKKVIQSGEGIEYGGNRVVRDPINNIVTSNATMSPDAYSWIYRTAKTNPEKFHIAYQMNAGDFNSFARNPKNSFMYDVEQQLLRGEISPQEYISRYNAWTIPLGGRPAYIYNNKIYKPQPFLVRNKQGGLLQKKD